MTVDLSIIEDRLRRVDEYLITLHQLANLPEEELTQNKILLGSAERYLQVAIEACLDITNHIIGAEHLRAPQSYADAFTVLAEIGILPSEFLPVTRRMAHFRNRLVHLYWQVDAPAIYEIL